MLCVFAFLDTAGLCMASVLLYAVLEALWVGKRKIALYSGANLTLLSVLSYLQNISRIDLLISNWQQGGLYFDLLNANASKGTLVLQTVMALLNCVYYCAMYSVAVTQAFYVYLMLQTNSFQQMRQFCVSRPLLYFSLAWAPSFILLLLYLVENQLNYDVIGQYAVPRVVSTSMIGCYIYCLISIFIVFYLGLRSRTIMSHYIESSESFNKSDITPYFINQTVQSSIRMPLNGLLVLTDRLVWVFPSAFTLGWSYFYSFMRVLSALLIFQSVGSIPEVMEHMPFARQYLQSVYERTAPKGSASASGVKMDTQSSVFQSLQSKDKLSDRQSDKASQRTADKASQRD
ncbi:hypothetical protein EDD86DRAFT_246841 [Gorgonomyces haynaldii]|nr:hypothetical protein EDD86DRAFT_246841 [Gorgonomyces haynaldii]